MGQTLSEPITEKHTTGDRDGRLIYAASAMQGWRLGMEDAHTSILKLDNPNQPDKHLSFFAVFDGHGGRNVAVYSGQHLHKRLVDEQAFQEGNYEQALRSCFLNIDEEMRSDEDIKGQNSGCTAVAVLITDDWRLFCSNAGDSRAIMSRGGNAVALSNDHKPVNPEEKNRIVAAGGFVELGRVNGNLALSRALGDFEFKKNPMVSAEKQIVTADPDILEFQLNAEDEFAVIACDGIFDCATNEQVVDYVRSHLSKGATLETICEKLMSKLIAKDANSRGLGLDNMTIVIVGFLRGDDEASWRAKIKERYEASSKTSKKSSNNELDEMDSSSDKDDHPFDQKNWNDYDRYDD